ncbi:metallophosphoesterase [Georgenia sp. 311]|uniref:phosphodiester glycosidase family protein n=1 Tax=Georgenia sp. 311 TaxID=2585134 RepID=UPI001112AA17|nr:phosphodiester glycosidase family protein [Georgenia sp. 311]TNC21487.1 metallophosphoesterase [Georgenia sp. 311]
MSHLRSAPRPARLAASATVAALLAAGFVAATPHESHAATQPVVVAGMELDAGGAAIVTDVDHTVLAPGLDHVTFERLDADGWLQVNVLKAELGDSTVRADYIGPERVAQGATVSEMAERAGAVAAVNGDFFDINNSWAPAGAAVSSRDGILKSPNPGRGQSVAFDESGLGRITRLLLEGTVELPDATLPLSGVNLFAMPAGGLTVYTSHWGEYTRTRAVPAGETGVEVLLDAEGRVTSVGTPGEGQLPEGTQALVARPGAAADALAALEPGAQVTVAYALDQEDVRVAVGGQPEGEPPVLADGVVGSADGEYNTTRHPRTAIGFSEDGATAYFVVVDGRQATSRGLSLRELGELMLDLGAHDALNVDGGGSSQMNAREPGAEGTTVRNSPSDGYEREDANGLGLFLSVPGSGALTAFRVEPLSGDEDAHRLFPGLHRTLTAHGMDETFSPVAGAPSTWASDSAAATVSEGVVVGAEPGSAVVTASTGEATGTLDVEVLGPLARLTASQNVLNLEAEGSSATITLTGHDAEGFTAPVEARDVTVTNPDPQTFTVTPTPEGAFEVTATGAEGSAVLTLAVGEVSVELVVAVPLELRVIDDLSAADRWTSAHDRAPGGTVVPAEGHDGGDGLRMTYDFTQSTGTRGQYAVAPGGAIEIPGRPQKLSVWVDGDGNGALLRLQVRQANGVVGWIDGPGGSQSLHITWEGWQRVDFVVPSSFETPLTLERIRVLETVAAKQYTGEVGFSDIYAYLPPDGVPAPKEQRVTDPLVVPTGETDDDDLRVAVMSDAQFVARNPESGAVEGARDAFREIVAEDPDLLVINGDLVDEAAPEDFDLARTIIEEELGDAPFDWYYVPGNHEVMGGPIANFVEEFGATSHAIDLGATRVVTLSSATGRLAADFAQVQMLREQLDAAAADDSVTGVLVFAHHPTNDPLPTKNSQLTDRHETAMIDSWLAQWRAETGKSVAYVGAHVGVFDTARVDGVPYVINGNAGKSPSSTPADGGFTGWTMLGVDPEAGRWAESEDEWLAVEVQTRVDELTVTAPQEALGAGEQVVLEAEVTQDDTRTFGLAWPMSWAWSGSQGVHVGAVADAPADAVVALDPATGTVTGLRAGTVEVTLAVNDATTTVPVAVTGGVVAVTGRPVVGSELRADMSGWDLSDSAEVTFQWLRDGAPIAGATSGRYTPVAADAAAMLAVRATVSAPGLATVSGTSEPVGPVAPAPGSPTPVGDKGFHLSNTWRGTTDVYFAYGRSTDEVLIGDWDADGRDTITVRRGTAFHVSNAQRGGAAETVLHYGRPGDVVLVGDWDGDGRDTFAVRRGAEYHVKNSLSGGPADTVVVYGRAGDEVLVGDWDGDGRDTFAVRRGQIYHVKDSLRPGPADVVLAYGRAGDVVLSGDWDGDGRDTLAVRRGATYYVSNSLRSGEAERVVTFGRPGDEVLVGDWDGDTTDTLGIRRT